MSFESSLGFESKEHKEKRLTIAMERTTKEIGMISSGLDNLETLLNEKRDPGALAEKINAAIEKLESLDDKLVGEFKSAIGKLRVRYKEMMEKNK